MAASRTAKAKPRPANVHELAIRLQGKAWAVGRLEDLDSLVDRVTTGATRPRLEGPNFTAGDPLDVGVRGGYPQVNDGKSPTGSLLPFVRMAYNKSAPARVIVDRVAADQWDEWFELQGGEEAFRLAVEAFMKRPTNRVGEKPLWWWFKRATRLARRDGRCLLHFGLIESGVDTSKPPTAVKGVRYLQVIKEDRIVGKTVEDDESSDDYGQVLRWKVRVADDEGAAGFLDVEVDAGRVIPFIPEPSEDDLWAGDSPLATNINYVQAVENMLFAALQAYSREAEPLYVVYKESTTPGSTINADERAAVKKEIRKTIEENTERAAFVHGVRVEVLGSDGSLADPKPHWDIAIQAYMMATGMPRPVITGEVIGELVAAREASRRWASVISKVQESDGDPIVNILLDRLRKWDVKSWVQIPGKDAVQIKWKSLLEEDVGAEALRQKALADARAIYADRHLPPPADLDYDVSEDPEMLEGFAKAERPASAAFGGALPQARAEAGTVAGGPPDSIMERARKRIMRALQPAFLAAARAIKGSAPGDVGVGFQDPKLRSALADAVADSMMDAGDDGERATLRRLKAEDLRRFMDRDGQAQAFRTVGAGLAPKVADRLATEVRALVAKELAAGTSLDGVSRAIMARFDATRVDADRIARSESVLAWNAGAVQGMKQAGVESYTWLAFADADEGEDDGVCQALDGKTFPVGTGPLPVRDTHPNCRCALVPNVTVPA